MRSFPTELRLALRTLIKARGFTITAVVTLALGMALCAPTVAVIKAYVLHDLPYPESDRLYWIRYGTPGTEQPRDMETVDWKSMDDVLEHHAAWDLDVFYL